MRDDALQGFRKDVHILSRSIASANTSVKGPGDPVGQALNIMFQSSTKNSIRKGSSREGCPSGPSNQAPSSHAGGASLFRLTSTATSAKSIWQSKCQYDSRPHTRVPKARTYSYRGVPNESHPGFASKIRAASSRRPSPFVPLPIRHRLCPHRGLPVVVDNNPGCTRAIPSVVPGRCLLSAPS
jgi:hypothetical protein